VREGFDALMAKNKEGVDHTTKRGGKGREKLGLLRGIEESHGKPCDKKEISIKKKNEKKKSHRSGQEKNSQKKKALGRGKIKNNSSRYGRR